MTVPSQLLGHVPQFSMALVIQLDAHALLMLQVGNDGVLRQKDISEHQGVITPIGAVVTVIKKFDRQNIALIT